MKGSSRTLLKTAANQASRYLNRTQNAPQVSDVVAVGGGLSAIIFLNAFTKEKNIEGSRITIVDGGNFKTTPWHHENSPVPLLQHQSFGDYGEEFLDWSDRKRSEILDFVAEKGGAPAQEWIDDNKEFLANASSEELVSDWTRRFPRAVIGKYLDEKKEESVQRAQDKGVDLKLVDGLVRDVEKVKEGYSVLVASNANDPMSAALLLKAKEMIVGIGIPDAPEKESLKKSPDYYGNMYRDNNFNNLLDDINRKYEEKGGQKVDVNVTGFGPSGLDVVYWLYTQGLADPSFNDKYNLTVIGNIDKLRPGAYHSGNEKDFQPEFKELYQKPQQVMSDIDENIQKALSQGYTEGEARTAIRNNLKTFMKDMPESVQGQFKGAEYMPVYLNKLSSEAHESHSSVNKLKEKGILKVIDGKVDTDSLTEKKDGGFEFKYYDKHGTYDSKCDIYVNCAHNLSEELQKIKKETWLGRLSGEKDVHITGFNASFKEGYEFEAMDVYPQAPSIAKVMKQLAKDVNQRINERNGQGSDSGRTL